MGGGGDVIKEGLVDNLGELHYTVLIATLTVLINADWIERSL